MFKTLVPMLAALFLLPQSGFAVAVDPYAWTPGETLQGAEPTMQTVAIRDARVVHGSLELMVDSYHSGERRLPMILHPNRTALYSKKFSCDVTTPCMAEVTPMSATGKALRLGPTRITISQAPIIFSTEDLLRFASTGVLQVKFTPAYGYIFEMDLDQVLTYLR